MRKPRQKKAQVKMMESIFTLVIFAMLIGFGMFFYFVFSKGEAQQKKLELSEQKMVEVALMVSQLPEVQCSEGNVEGGACVDLMKLAALSVAAQIPDYKIHYYDLFTYSTLSVVFLYPATADSIDPVTITSPPPVGDQIITLDPNIDGNNHPGLVFYDGKPSATDLRPGESLDTRVILFPITIRDVRTDSKYFGLLEVAVYAINRKVNT